ncbi:MAG: DNA repair protein RadA [Planctomycetota bacterium]|nr:DNA repair protein RadA [Planctomycetota bacterium]
MARTRSQFLCNHCGGLQLKWLGKCPDCGTWDSLEAFTPPTPDARAEARGKIDARAAAEATPISQIDEAHTPRLSSGIAEFDRVLGGGLVAGSVVLVGGEPGIGKSTLLLQVAQKISSGKNGRGAKVLYVTSEESARQTALRAVRLGVKSDDLLVLAETNVERIVHQITRHNPAVAIVDSIQMIYKPNLPAAPGSLTQLRDACMDLVYLAKTSGTSIILVGHVTKAGTLAGPKVIEHIVDTVAYFEGDRFHSHRIVRCVKNRFGATHEVGLFEMTGHGLTEVTDPGKLFVEQYGPGGQPSGSVIAAAIQGSRVLLVEVQALTASSVIGAAKRKTSGLSADRVAMIIAVLEKRAEMRLAADDVFVNVAGGVKTLEPAVDLAVALAIASAHLNRPLAPGTLAIGELGLGGEIRSVPQIELRLREAARLGVGHAIIPPIGKDAPKLKGMALHEVRRLSQALAGI